MNGKSGGKELDKLQSQSWLASRSPGNFLILYKKVLDFILIGDCKIFEGIIFFKHF